MRILVAVLLLTSASMFAQSGDRLSPEEIKAAVDAKPGVGFVLIEDMGFTTPSLCHAQMPSEAIFTPAGWLNAISINARKQFLPFNPTPEDIGRNLTVISRGCANGTPSGPVCDSITRVVLISDKAGTAKAEAVLESPLSQTWQNGFGANTACASLVSRFPMSEVQKVRNAKGEFLIATFNGASLLKIYTVKEKHIKQLGM